MLNSFNTFLEQVSGKRLVVFLDYDGTLTPIVSNPDHAYMSSSMREIVKDVGRTFPTAIISGRGRLKVEDFVQLDELFYAGSHGLDIKGPVVRFLHGVHSGQSEGRVHVVHCRLKRVYARVRRHLLAAMAAVKQHPFLRYAGLILWGCSLLSIGS